MLQKQPAERERNPKSSSPFVFCRICTCSFAICLRNFGKTPCIYQLLKPRTKVITLSVTLHVHVLYRRESLFFNMFWNFALIQKSSAAPKQACIAFLQSAGTHLTFAGKIMEGIQSFSISIICFFT